MTEYTMTIDGKAAPTLGSIDVVNPATGSVFATAPDCTRDQLDLAMESAERAFTDWRKDLDRRREYMLACADALAEHVDELSELTTMEQGQPLAAARLGIAGAPNAFRRAAAIDLPRQVVQDDDQALIELVYEPVGVLAAIKPWNFPLGMALGAVAPAFRAGCTVVLKPSPFTPLVTLRLGEILRDVLPAGVLNVVSGADPLGQWMVEHPIPRGVSFTGSVATGKKVNTSAAPDLKRVLLELGGNDPAIVLDDVDPEEVAEEIFWRAFRNAGQICMAVKRVYVPESLHDEIVDAFARRAQAVRVGNGLEEGVTMGPINNAPQYERVKGLVADALADGAVAAAGGAPIDGPGYFFEPTILTGLKEGTRIVEEEQFGPALPILPYHDIEDAIEQANSTNYGLGSSIWSSDPARARAVAERIEAGTTWINTHAAIGAGAPFGGVKWSGLGAQNGIYSVLAFCDPHVIHRSRTGLKTAPRD